MMNGSPNIQYIFRLASTSSVCLTLYQKTNFCFWTWPNWKHLQMINWTLLEWQFLFVVDLKTLWEKKKMLVTSIFFFSHSVSKALGGGGVRKKSGLCGKELKPKKNENSTFEKSFSYEGVGKQRQRETERLLEQTSYIVHHLFIAVIPNTCTSHFPSGNKSRKCTKY